MKEYILSGLVGAVIGYCLSLIINGIINYYSELSSKKRIFKTAGELDNINFTNIGGYMPIDHSVPEYNENNIVINKDNDELIIGIPEEYIDRLRTLGFAIHEDNLNAFQDRITQSFQLIGVEDSIEVLRSASIEVAKIFIDDLSKGFVRFNGHLFGVNHLSLNRVGIEENSSINLRVYKSDYFTYRVFAYVYQQYKERFDILNIASLNNITPFLSSFGIGCFVIANNGERDFVVLAERSGNVVVDKNKKHFSMNEAFSLLDVDFHGNPNFAACLYRGLKEELGITEMYSSRVYQYGFLDLGLDANRLEMGISCYAKIRFDNNFTPSLMRELYALAKDRELETKELVFIPFDELDQYLANNKREFSSGCFSTLTFLNTRHKMGLLRDKSMKRS